MYVANRLTAENSLHSCHKQSSVQTSFTSGEDPAAKKHRFSLVSHSVLDMLTNKARGLETVNESENHYLQILYLQNEADYIYSIYGLMCTCMFTLACFTRRLLLLFFPPIVTSFSSNPLEDNLVFVETRFKFLTGKGTTFYTFKHISYYLEQEMLKIQLFLSIVCLNKSCTLLWTHK